MQKFICLGVLLHNYKQYEKKEYEKRKWDKVKKKDKVKKQTFKIIIDLNSYLKLSSAFFDANEKPDIHTSKPQNSVAGPVL